MLDLPAASRLIVAMDTYPEDEEYETIEALSEEANVSFFKIGLPAVATGDNNSIRHAAGENGCKVFLDLKMFDTPDAIEKAIENAGNADISFMSISFMNGTTTMERAVIATAGYSISLLGSTALLSSTHPENLDSLRDFHKVAARDMCNQRQLDGMIVPGCLIKSTRETIGHDRIIVAPGIRLPGHEPNDHGQALTPAEAIAAGADYVVVGRPITDHGNTEDMVEAAKNYIASIHEGLKERERAEGLALDDNEENASSSLAG